MIRWCLLVDWSVAVRGALEVLEPMMQTGTDKGRLICRCYLCLYIDGRAWYCVWWWVSRRESRRGSFVWYLTWNRVVTYLVDSLPSFLHGPKTLRISWWTDTHHNSQWHSRVPRFSALWLFPSFNDRFDLMIEVHWLSIRTIKGEMFVHLSTCLDVATADSLLDSPFGSEYTILAHRQSDLFRWLTCLMTVAAQRGI